MLKIINYNSDAYEFPCLLVLGCFDAVHVGHAELLKNAALQAKINGLDLGVLMFAEGKGGNIVYTFEERVSFLEHFNVKFVLKAEFNEEFKKTKPLDFLHALEDKLNVKAYMSGKDFRFGEGAKGKVSTLKKYAEDDENGVWFMTVKDVLYDGGKVSTTLIKYMLENGDVQTANLLLGREFSVAGTVVNGAGRGGKVLGIPTMNLIYPREKVRLKRGVYTVRCSLDGKFFYGVANFGARPTFGEDEDVLEVHLQNFDDDFYGRTVTVEFESFIRDIEKFETVEALKSQIEADMKKIQKTAANRSDENTAEDELAVTEISNGVGNSEADYD